MYIYKTSLEIAHSSVHEEKTAKANGMVADAHTSAGASASSPDSLYVHTEMRM